jgi:hypothetical protein
MWDAPLPRCGTGYIPSRMSARLTGVRGTDVLDGYVRVLARAGYAATTAELVALELDLPVEDVRAAIPADDLLPALAGHVRDAYGRAIRESIAARPPHARLDGILDLVMLETEPFASSGVAAAISELAAAATRNLEAAHALREIYTEFELMTDMELAAAIPEADPQARREVAFAVMALAYSAPDFATMGFPDDRVQALRAAASRLVDTLR